MSRARKLLVLIGWLLLIPPIILFVGERQAEPGRSQGTLLLLALLSLSALGCFTAAMVLKRREMRASPRDPADADSSDR